MVGEKIYETIMAKILWLGNIDLKLEGVFKNNFCEILRRGENCFVREVRVLSKQV